MEIITYSESIEQGHVKYYTGKKCRKGHDCERYTSSGRCVECAKEYMQKQRKRIADGRKRRLEREKAKKKEERLQKKEQRAAE